MNNSFFKIVFILICGLVISVQAIFAQKLEIVTPLAYGGVIKSNEICKDLNDNPCAKIVINAQLKDIAITGSYILNDIETSNGKYSVTVSIPQREGKKITIKHNDYESLEIPLWCNGKPLEGGCYYNVEVTTKERTLYSERKIIVWSVQDVIHKAITDFKTDNSVAFLADGVGWKELKSRNIEFPSNLFGNRYYKFPNMDSFLLEDGMNDVKLSLGFYTALTNITNKSNTGTYNCVLCILGGCNACIDGAAIHIQIPSTDINTLLNSIEKDLNGKLVGQSKKSDQTRYVYGMPDKMYLYIVVRQTTTSIFISTDDLLYDGGMKWEKEVNDIRRFLGKNATYYK